MCKVKMKSGGGIPSVRVTSAALTTAAGKTGPGPVPSPTVPRPGCPPGSRDGSFHRGIARDPLSLEGDSACFHSRSCFVLNKTFWVSNQLFEFPIGRLITSYWLIRKTFLPPWKWHIPVFVASLFTHILLPNVNTC